MLDQTDSQAPNYDLLTDPEDIWEAVTRLQAAGEVHALDFETTSLSPHDGAVRITSICGPAVRAVIDHKNLPFSDVAEAIAVSCPLAVFNAGFEGRWFDHETPEPLVNLLDVGYMSKAKLGGRPLSLADMVKRDLGKVRDNKHLQKSGWTGDLTAEQYDYAFEDAEDTFALFQHWDEELTDDQYAGFLVFNDAWRGTAEMEDTGMLLDEAHHERLIAMWERRRAVSYATLRRFTPESMIENIRSKKQISDFLKTVLDGPAVAAWPKTEKTQQLQTTRTVLRQASFRSPYPFSRWAAALMVFNRADKYLSTYGETLLTKQRLSADGRIRGRFNIAQAVTGRYSSSNPNLQNIPRNPMVRRSFIAPTGADFVAADYSGIELRVLAELSGDEQLKKDVIYGNVHAESAITLFGMDRNHFMAVLGDHDDPHHAQYKEMRSKAKGFSFQLTYGAGTAALAVVLRCTDDEAAQFVNKWAERYPKAYALRFKMHGMVTETGFLPVKSGRTIYVPKPDRSLPVASNYPIQGSAADVMYRAIARMERALNAGGYKAQFDPMLDEFVIDYDARMLATVHDELLSLAEAGRGSDLEAMQVACMKDAWLDIFPGTSVDNLVESAVGRSWACKP